MRAITRFDEQKRFHLTPAVSARIDAITIWIQRLKLRVGQHLLALELGPSTMDAVGPRLRRGDSGRHDAVVRSLVFRPRGGFAFIELQPVPLPASVLVEIVQQQEALLPRHVIAELVLEYLERGLARVGHAEPAGVHGAVEVLKHARVPRTRFRVLGLVVSRRAERCAVRYGPPVTAAEPGAEPGRADDVPLGTPVERREDPRRHVGLLRCRRPGCGDDGGCGSPDRPRRDVDALPW